MMMLLQGFVLNYIRSNALHIKKVITNALIDVIEKGRCSVTERNVQIVMQTKSQPAAGQRTQAKQSRKMKVGPLQIDDID